MRGASQLLKRPHHPRLDYFTHRFCPSGPWQRNDREQARAGSMRRSGPRVILADRAIYKTLMINNDFVSWRDLADFLADLEVLFRLNLADRQSAKPMILCALTHRFGQSGRSVSRSGAHRNCRHRLGTGPRAPPTQRPLHDKGSKLGAYRMPDREWKRQCD